MRKKANPELIDEENPEWTDEDFARAKPARDMLPEIFGAELAADILAGKVKFEVDPKLRPKQRVARTIRFDADVLEALEASGEDWRERVNAIAREWVESHREHRT
jgi:uncharacterized protein (DUF4415 family)